MRSKVATELSRRRRDRIAVMTPAERVALAARLGEEGLSAYMATHRVDRATALTRIRATRRAGRRPSPASRANDD